MSVDAASGHRRLLVPEVVQISAMDCGPASLKCLLEGYGISVSYGRLREACQTDVDGTSINTMEEVAVQLGLVAEQIMLPVDHLLLPEAQALPAIVVVRQAGNLTHFIIVWRSYGRFVQVMDPAIGRRWLTARRLLDELYVHVIPVPAMAWREWAGTDEFRSALRRRLAQLGLSQSAGGRMLNAALADPSWHAFAALDAATRMVDAIVRAGGLRAGRQAARALAAFFEQAREEAAGEGTTIPQSYWLVSQVRLGRTVRSNSSYRVRCWSACAGDAGGAGHAQRTRWLTARTHRLRSPLNSSRLSKSRRAGPDARSWLSYGPTAS